jgi:hypothetical protein
VGQQHELGIDVVLVPQPLEDVVHYPLVVLGVGVGEKVEGNAQLLPGVQKLGVVLVQHLLRGGAFLFRPDRDGSAVGVASRHHQHFVPNHPVVPGEYVRRQVASGYVTHVEGTIGVGPSDTDENTFCHREFSYALLQGFSRSEDLGLLDTSGLLF